MSMPFSLTGIHLRDGLHPGPVFLMQVFNIYLNLYKQHQIELGKLPAPKAQVRFKSLSGVQSADRFSGCDGRFGDQTVGRCIMHICKRLAHCLLGDARGGHC